MTSKLRRFKERIGLAKADPNARKLQPNVKSKRSSLNTLPPEMINRLKPYLDPLAIAALSHTCKKLNEDIALDRSRGIFEPDDLTYELDKTPSGVEQKTHIMVTDPLGPGIYTGFNLTRRTELSKLVHLEMRVDSNMYWIRDQTKFTAPNLATLILRLQASESTGPFSYPDGLPNFFRDRKFPALTTLIFSESDMFKTEYAWTPTLLKSLLTFLNKHENLETLKFPPLWPVESTTRPVPVQGQGEVLKKIKTLGGHVTFVNALKMMVQGLTFDELHTLDLGDETGDTKEPTKPDNGPSKCISTGVRVLRVVSKEKIQNVNKYFDEFPQLRRLYLESLDKILLDKEAQQFDWSKNQATLICAYSHTGTISRVMKINMSGQYACIQIERDDVNAGTPSIPPVTTQNDPNQSPPQANSQNGAQQSAQDGTQANAQGASQSSTPTGNTNDGNAQANTQNTPQGGTQGGTQSNPPNNAQPDPSTNAPAPNSQAPNSQAPNSPAPGQANAGGNNQSNTTRAAQNTPGAPAPSPGPKAIGPVVIHPSSHAYALHRALNLASEEYYHSIDLPPSAGPVSTTP